MNPYNELKYLVEEVQGTESEAMKNIAAVTAKIKANKARIERGRAAAAKAKTEKKRKK